MSRFPRVTFALLLTLSFFALPSFAQKKSGGARPPAKTFSENSYARARKILEQGLDALGGLEAMREAGDVTLKVRGHTFARHQSVRVSPPYDRMERDEDIYLDVRNRRYIFENRDPLPGGFVFGGRQVINGTQGFFINPRDKTVQPLNLTNFNNIGFVRRVPHLLLLAAFESAPASLRHFGQTTYDKRQHEVINFASSNGAAWTLFFDAHTHLLTKYEQMLSDNFSGDTAQETIFHGYRTVGKLKVPTRRVSMRAGELIEDVRYEDVQFGRKLPDSAFVKPEGLEELPQPTPPAIRETKLADGVYLFEGASNSLVVEFADHVMVVEPNTGGRGPKPTFTKAREMFPNKPVRYVVITHHHDDHSGGMRSYVAQEGVRIVTTPANQNYFERMASNTFTLNPDDQQRAPRPPVFEFVRDKRRVFTDGTQTVEIIDIGPSPHADEMLIAYLPKEKLVFQGDLVILPASGKYTATTVNDTTLHFADAIKRLGLDVKRIAAVHGPVTTRDELNEAIEKKRRQ